jgi:hypothetical protein
LTAWIGNVSRIGLDGGSPYTAAVDEKTMCFTPVSTIAVSSESEPPTLLAK